MSARIAARPDVFETLYLADAEQAWPAFPWRALYGLAAVAAALVIGHVA